MDSKIKQFIQERRDAGKTEDQIKAELLKAGWDEEQIRELEITKKIQVIHCCIVSPSKNRY